MSHDRQGAGAPIVVDVALAMKQLEENPDLAAKMNELAFGPFAAGQLAARDELIEGLVEALHRLSTECRLAGLEGQAGFDCWLAYADKTLAKARGEA
ncbi:hypothetical protein ACS5UA_07580 [Brucella sp. RRSP16]|uniref:hypothetical protein n=1 Tax=Brucella TaxID=234 RepID=UPI0033067B6E